MSQTAPITAGKVECPRCDTRMLNPVTLRCFCGAEFTEEGLAYWRALPRSQAVRT